MRGNGQGIWARVNGSRRRIRSERASFEAGTNQGVCRGLLGGPTFELSRLGHTKWEYAKQRCVVQVGLNERLGVPRQSALFKSTAFAFSHDAKRGKAQKWGLRQRRMTSQSGTNVGCTVDWSNFSSRDVQAASPFNQFPVKSETRCRRRTEPRAGIGGIMTTGSLSTVATAERG